LRCARANNCRYRRCCGVRPPGRSTARRWGRTTDLGTCCTDASYAGFPRGARRFLPLQTETGLPAPRTVGAESTGEVSLVPSELSIPWQTLTHASTGGAGAPAGDGGVTTLSYLRRIRPSAMRLAASAPRSAPSCPSSCPPRPPTSLCWPEEYYRIGQNLRLSKVGRYMQPNTPKDTPGGV
jgi:hypothetical protein